MDQTIAAPRGALERVTARPVAVTMVVVALCVLLNGTEVIRSGVNAQNWGLLADLSEAVLPLLAAFLFARRAITTGKKGWWWLSAGALAWALGQVTWMILDFGLGMDPTVSVATVGFVGWSIITAIGLLKIGGQNSGFTSPRPIVAEAMIMAACAGFLVWELALASETAGQSALELVMLAIVPISTAFVGSVAVLLLLHDRSPAIGMIGLASVVLIVADSLLTIWFSDNAPLYATAHVLYLLTFALIAAASFLPHHRGRRAARSTLSRLAVVYVPLILAIWVAIWHYFIQHRSASVVSLFITFSIGVLVALGQFTAWSESSHLADRLQSNIERLSDLERHLRELLDDLPVSVVLLSGDGRIIDVNSVAVDLTGRAHEESIGQPFTALLRPEDVDGVLETWMQFLHGEVMSSPLFAVPHVDGSFVMVEAEIRLPVPRADRVVVLLRDMTARLQRNRELEEAQRRFQVAFRSAPTGMLLSSPSDFRLLDVNDALADMLGTTRAAMIGKSVRDITHPDDWSATLQNFASGAEGGPSSYTMDQRLIRNDGQVVWTQTSVSLMSDDGGQEMAIAHIQDITDQRRTAAHLQWAASHDELTGLPNRNHFLDQLRRRLDGAELGSIAVLFIDLDNFKVVNDSLGHAVGDELLRGMSERLRSVVRDRDMLGRFGGDEFIVMLDGLQLEVSPVDVAERLRRAISQMLIVEDSELYVTGSIGIAYADRAGVTADELLRDADAAMYRAKARGRDCVEVFAPGAHETSVLALRTSSELRHGLERGEIVPYYQPIVDLRSGQLTGFEVLARWRHPDRGLLGPDQFLPMAEETGLIGELGAAVVRSSLAQLGLWQANVPSLANVSISVNVSVRQLVDSRFNRLVAEALAESGVRAESLWLEITESALMSDVKAATVALRNLRSLGLHLSVDDFGTGYSSLTYLKRFPVEAIKVDRQFVKGLGIDAEDSTIVEAVINLGKSLGLMVVAEGVETPLQLSRLRETGCDRAQGYLFGRPRPAALIEAERASA
jgi:diguanylate cyclase (GGDEF)-like protein/PAS domain S-box-containing protein